MVVEKLTLSSAENASPSEADKQKPGFILQILNKDKSPAKAVRDYSGFKEGEELIFTTSQEFKSITGQLTAGGEYWLHEVKPRDGYALAEDVPFTVDRDGNRQIVVMADRPTHVVLSKKALTGSRSFRETIWLSVMKGGRSWNAGFQVRSPMKLQQSLLPEKRIICVKKLLNQGSLCGGGPFYRERRRKRGSGGNEKRCDQSADS